jgi:hypothetical protein
MGNFKFISSRLSRYKRAWHRTYRSVAVRLITENCQRVKAISHQTRTQRDARRQIPPPDRPKARDHVPFSTLTDLQGNDLITVAPVKNVTLPSQHSNASIGSESAKP